jgi:quercetin dioxygenase-like cupin family protein
VPSRSSPAYAFREHVFRFLATGEQTGGSYSAMEIDSPRETGAGPHTHDLAEEHFYLLDGEVRFTVADHSIVVRPGDFVHVPRATVHHFTVLTDTARFLATYTPAGEELAFLELGTPITDP